MENMITISKEEYSLMKNLIESQALVISLLNEARASDNQEILDLKQAIDKIKTDNDLF